MEKLINEMREVMDLINNDIDTTTKAAEARVRKNTLLMDKLNKRYRKESIAQHK